MRLDSDEIAAYGHLPGAEEAPKAHSEPAGVELTLGVDESQLSIIPGEGRASARISRHETEKRSLCQLAKAGSGPAERGQWPSAPRPTTAPSPAPSVTRSDGAPRIDDQLLPGRLHYLPPTELAPHKESFLVNPNFQPAIPVVGLGPTRQ